MSKHDKTEAPRVLPDLTPAKVKFATVGDGIRAAIEGDELVLRLDFSERARANAKASKSGALCMAAGGGFKWHNLTKFLGSVVPEGTKLQLSLGIPNPAYDKVAAAKAKALAEFKRLGLGSADLENAA